MTTQPRPRRVSAPAYYLGRPTTLWLAALAPRPGRRMARRASCAGNTRCSCASDT